MKLGQSRSALSRRKFIGLAGAGLVSSVTPLWAAGRVLSGHVFHREGIALPPEALLNGLDQTDVKVEFVQSAAAMPSAATGRWRSEAIRNRPVPSDFAAVIEIAADGRVTGSTGCNRISARATVDGAHMSFGPILSTKMACAEAITDHESNFLSALADTRLWRFDETRDKLILVDAHGMTVLRLVRM